MSTRVASLQRYRHTVNQQSPIPTCKALLLCDDTILEAGTGKISLIGVFRRFGLPRIPGRTRPFHAFIQLTNAQGVYDVVVEVRDLATDEVIAEASGPGIEIKNRLDVFNIIIPAPPLPIENEGAYDFIVFANRNEIDRQQFNAVLLQSNEDLENDD